jgi:type II secretory ATPase GspE/PulE/Tfp pilus assembly ATPase PilB-like protein
MRRLLPLSYDLLLFVTGCLALLTLVSWFGRPLAILSGGPESALASLDALAPFALFIAGGWVVLVAGRFVIHRNAKPSKRVQRGGAKIIRSTADLSGIQRDVPDAIEKAERVLAEEASDPAFDAMDLVDDIIIIASQLGASDIHLEPKENSLRLSLRIDGVMRDVTQLPKPVEARLMNRLKIISRLDITKLESPQDGRVQDPIRGKLMNLRVSVFPTHHGTKGVIRLLDSGSHKVPGLDDLEIAPSVLDRFRRLLRAPQGLVLITGPTGSGKTTLMYAALRDIVNSDTSRKNIVTLEDPIERVLEDVNQTQVDLKRGLTFASGLRTLLRQDPDVMMVGEIRDLDTAQIALQAGQTGHLLLTTLHTNSAAAAFSRLIDMGLEPFLLSASISGVCAVRLVRRLCPTCRTRHTPLPALLEQLKIDPAQTFYESTGCGECNGTGFTGRLAIFELLPTNDAVADIVVRKGSVHDILKAAQSNGMVTLFEDGMGKVISG